MTVQQLSAKTWRQWMPAFLEALYEADGHVVRAVEAVRPSRASIYAHKDKCPLFSELWDWVLTFKGVKDRPAWEEVFPAHLPRALAHRVGATAAGSPPSRRWPMTAGNFFSEEVPPCDR
jgi:hypothetical protein